MLSFTEPREEFEWRQLYAVNDREGVTYVVLANQPVRFDDSFRHFQIAGNFEGEPVLEDVWCGKDGNGNAILTYRAPDRDEHGNRILREMTVTVLSPELRSGFTVYGPYKSCGNSGVWVVLAMAALTIVTVGGMIGSAVFWR